MGHTEHNCPDSIFPLIEFPRGRNETVSPFRSAAMYCDAQPMPGILSLWLLQFTRRPEFCTLDWLANAA